MFLFFTWGQTFPADRKRIVFPPHPTLIAFSLPSRRGEISRLPVNDDLFSVWQSTLTLPVSSSSCLLPLYTNMEITFEPREGHRATLVFLHGFSMSAEEMACELAPVVAELPWLRLVVPEAAVAPVTAYGGDEFRSWFDYLTDRDGEAEDSVDASTVRSARAAVQRLLWREHTLAPPEAPVVLGGLSQGGCLALDVATRDSNLAAVVTCVAHRLHLSRARPLLCPWHALSAGQDDVFPASWAQPLPEDGVLLTVAETADHYLSGGELAPFVTEAMRSVVASGVTVTIDESVEHPRSAWEEEEAPPHLLP